MLRIDYFARQFRYEGPTLGPSEQWTEEALEQHPVVAVLATIHSNGFVRERAVRALIRSGDAGGDRALALRATDHVAVIREAAAAEVFRRTELDQANRIMPILHRLEKRGRGADVLAQYLHSLVSAHGEAEVWALLRTSRDRDLRRAAFQHSLETGLLSLADVLKLHPRENDQVVRRLLSHIVADDASTELVAQLLLHSRAADSRVLGLVRLTSSELHPDDVERLLVDRSVLVRFWARRRWEEIGRDPAATYAGATRSDATPAVRARAYLGLIEMNRPVDRDEIVSLVHSDELALRKVGLVLLKPDASAEDVSTLFELTAAANSRVARLAGEVLIRNPRLWSVPDLAALKSAEAPDLRRRAWWIHRNLGGWEAVIADLELHHDPDPHLAPLGSQPVAPMYFRPTAPQKQRIGELLKTSHLRRDQLLSIAVAAGLRELP
ncbi:hypothetical protein [Kribbella sp. DT2]|uniref:hypothetical protein n=1 Tax=Kribbella sp. DT2 TaxID=3393427 RepID=UPI003CF7E8FF